MADEKPSKNIYIYDYKTFYDDTTRRGMEHLKYDLQREESRVFFDQARLRKTAQFEDDSERQFTLIYNGDNTYTLQRR